MCLQDRQRRKYLYVNRDFSDSTLLKKYTSQLKALKRIKDRKAPELAARGLAEVELNSMRDDRSDKTGPRLSVKN